MDTSNNYADFVDMFLDSDDNFEPYGCSDTNESLERVYNCIQTYKAGFNDREYAFDE